MKRPKCADRYHSQLDTFFTFFASQLYLLNLPLPLHICSSVVFIISKADQTDC